MNSIGSSFTNNLRCLSLGTLTIQRVLRMLFFFKINLYVLRSGCYFFWLQNSFFVSAGHPINVGIFLMKNFVLQNVVGYLSLAVIMEVQCLDIRC
jgi:hypothetical protein